MSIECVFDGLLHRVEKLNDEIEEWLDLLCARLWMMSLEIHYDLQAQNCIVLVFCLHHVHAFVNYLRCVWVCDVWHVGRYPVKNFQGRVP